tara:strand:+ start:10256 stop:10873 length:618 start_codon:yes stop_codon:yes gene_type:complete
MTVSISIVDYGVGNIKSVASAFKACGADVILTADHEEINKSDILVLPGVGSFVSGITNLRQKNLENIIRSHASRGKTVIGICLGMQLLMDSSEEFEGEQGLGLIEGVVKKIKTPNKVPIPHIGWETTTFTDREMDNSFNVDYFFCHSFSAHPVRSEDVLATCEYGGTSLCAAVKRGNVIGFQFHPEKSSTTGLSLIKHLINTVIP